MSFIYPSSQPADLESWPCQALRIARHTPCTACSTCFGLQPPDGVDVIVEDPDTFEDSALLNECFCGHPLSDHGADPAVGPQELRRRARVALRIDEGLEDFGKLLEFDYTDGDMESLRKQMTLPGTPTVYSQSPAQSPAASQSTPHSPTSSVLSDVPIPPPPKKRRISTSSLSDEEDEDMPLAQTVKAGGARSGKKTASSTHKRVGTMGPPRDDAPTASKGKGMKGPNGDKAATKADVTDVKLEGEQVERLATGVTVDTAAGSVEAPFREKAAAIEHRTGIIRTVGVSNDGNPVSFIILTGLKVLFQKQLPKMPREYITRLVFDKNSIGVALVKRGFKVVGGITYRPFKHRGFAEIVFCAVTSVDQVKGYGGHLMNEFKTHIKHTSPEIGHFLTYADNYAIGYFKKQGFSKDITLDRQLWAGYIKDYEGGTMMQCSMVRKVDYQNTRNTLNAQKEAVLSKIRMMSKSHVVHPGLPQFQNGRGEGVRLDPNEVPGLREIGWNAEAQETPRRPVRGPHHGKMQRLLVALQNHPLAWAFLQPVSKDDVTDYYDVIKKPMDFATMEYKLDNNLYPTVDEFLTDSRLIFDNCRLYNPQESVYVKNAAKMERFLEEMLLKGE